MGQSGGVFQYKVFVFRDMAIELKPEQEKALLAVIERELALPKLIADRERAEAALAAADAALQDERVQIEVSAQSLISAAVQRHLPAIVAATSARDAARSAEDAAKLGVVEVKP